MIKIDGFKEYREKLNKIPAELKNRANAVVFDIANDWAGRAKRSAPKDQGALYGQISATSTGEGKAEVVSPKEYSAFVEWGTKTKVNVPAELQNYASQFRGGKGGDAKKFIYDWCKRKGIDKKYWFLIYRSVMVKGITPHPFFFIHKPIMEKELNAKLSKIFEGY